MITIEIKKVSNMIFAVLDDTVVQAWNENEFTQRKLNNYMNKQQKNYNNNILFNIKL